jgi:circadian clock protein KaiC
VPARDASLRMLEVLKMRGQRSLPGLHSVRISSDGVQVFPRGAQSTVTGLPSNRAERLSVGIDEIDDMLGGGLPAGDSVLVDGPSGTGKSVLAAHFIAEGGQQHEPGLVVLLEEQPARFVARADAFGLEFGQLVADGTVELISLRGRDRSWDELVAQIHGAVLETGARRVVVDSLSSLQLAVASSLSLPEALKRLMEPMTSTGVTVWVNGASAEAGGSAALGYLFDDLISLRHVERHGRLSKLVTVVKMRSSRHSSELRIYDVGERGVRLGSALDDHSIELDTSNRTRLFNVQQRATH